MKRLVSKALRILLLATLILVALGGSFVAGAAVMPRENERPEFVHTRKAMPPPEWFETATEDQLLKQCGRDWDKIYTAGLSARLDVMERRLLALPASEDPLKNSGFLAIRWKDALRELAARPGFEVEATARFRRMIEKHPLSFDHKVYGRLALLELERRLNAQTPLPEARQRTTAELWAATEQAAARFEAQYAEWEKESREKAAKRKPDEPVWTSPPKEHDFHASHEQFYRQVTAALAPDSGVRAEDISRWQWGFWCGTGSEDFHRTRAIATLLASCASRTPEPVRANHRVLCANNLPWIDRDVRANEARLRSIERRLIASGLADPDAEWLGKLLANKHRGENTLSFENFGSHRIVARGGDAFAECLLRILDTPRSKPADLTPDPDMMRILRQLLRTESDMPATLSLRYEGDSDYPSITARLPHGGMATGGSDLARKYCPPDEALSPRVRAAVSARLDAMRAQIKASPQNPNEPPSRTPYTDE